MDTSFYAIILAGGAGARLWPLSLTLRLKQQFPLAGGTQTLLQHTASRVRDVFDAYRIYTVTNDEQSFEVKKQVEQVDPVLADFVLIEPQKRNTLPTILLVLGKIVGADPAAVMAVFPADLTITADDAWRTALSRALDLARQGRFVTFGVTPTKPATGYQPVEKAIFSKFSYRNWLESFYRIRAKMSFATDCYGYIHKGQPLSEGTFDVRGFVEKPDLDTATAYLESGDYAWNSGMFMFAAAEFLEAVRAFQPELWAWWEARQKAPMAENYDKLPDISVDYGIVEKIGNAAMVVADFSWDDLGNWEAIYRIGNKDAAANVIQGDVVAQDCRGNLLVSQGGALACVGLSDTIVVQTRDATLVCPRDAAQSVKDIVAELKKQGSPLVETHRTVRRPWGSYIVFEEGSAYKIKRIRADARGQAVAPDAPPPFRTLGGGLGHGSGAGRGTEILFTENQSADIPKTTRHRRSNPGKVPLAIIEIQTGPYLGEDDIVRYDDVYDRIKKMASRHPFF